MNDKPLYQQYTDDELVQLHKSLTVVAKIEGNSILAETTDRKLRKIEKEIKERTNQRGYNIKGINDSQLVILQYLGTQEVPPSFREIHAETRLSETTIPNVQYHINEMKRKGLVQKNKYKSRSTSLTPQGYFILCVYGHIKQCNK